MGEPFDLNAAPVQGAPLSVAHHDVDAISSALAACADKWVPEIFPKGRLVEGVWRVANIRGAPPRRQGSCVIQLAGENAGSWVDFEDPQRLKGRPLSTLKEGLGISGDELIRVALEIIERFGALSYLSGHVATRKDRDRSSELIEAAHTLQHAQPIGGTLAETYFLARGLAAAPASEDLLFNDNTTDWKTHRGEPALIARFRYPDGTASGGIHRTYLRPDGSWHTGKKMLGPCDGAVVMLAPPSPNGDLGIGEGIESTAAAMQFFGIPGWAACSDGGMRKFAIWLRENSKAKKLLSVKRLSIWADAKRAGVSAAGELLATCQEIGFPAQLFIPRGGDDFADDLLKGLDPQFDNPHKQEVLSPQSYAEINATIATLARDADPVEQRGAIMAAIRGLAVARLDAASEKLCLTQIRSRTGIPLADLNRALKQERRDLGVALKSALPATTSVVTELCQRYVFVKAVNALWDRQIRTLVTIDAVRHAHWSEMPSDEDGNAIDPRDILLKGKFGQPVDKADVIGFMPGTSEIFIDSGAVTLNMWTAPDLIPQPGSVQPFLDHIWYVLDGDRQSQDFVLDYLAHLIQRPDVKIKSAILIIGKPGIGKSLIGEMIATLIGRQNTTAVEDADLRSAFNEWMDGVQLVLVHELMSIERQETMNRLKSYITDPWLRINRKNIPSYRYQNRVNFLMFSNHDDAARIEKDDRRYFVWISDAEKRDPSYYRNLVNWFDDGGAAHLLHYLQSRDISGFDANASPPLTRGKERVVKNTRSATEAYLQDLYDAGDAPFRSDLVVVSDVIDYLSDKKNLKVTHKVLSNFLRSVGAIGLGQKRLAGRKPHVWAIRSAPEWEQVSEDDIRRAFRDCHSEAISDDEKSIILGRS